MDDIDIIRDALTGKLDGGRLKPKDELYLHIGNGGVTFGVSDERGPTIHVTATHFGNKTNEIVLHVEKEALRALGEMFLRYYEHGEFSEPYCCAAKTPKEEECCACGSEDD